MLKYVETDVTFDEIPSEITLVINISQCIFKCKGCHSTHLRQNIGQPLTCDNLDTLIEANRGVSTVCFMGGDIDPSEIDKLAAHVKYSFPELKVGWYSGAAELTIFTNLNNFDYIKLGAYKKKLGGLKNKTTNQRLYEVNKNGYGLKDITHKFWNRNDA